MEKMIRLLQITVEERSIIFPILEVRTAVFAAAAPPGGLQAWRSAWVPPLTHLLSQVALPGNCRSRTEPGAEFPPPAKINKRGI